MSDVLQERLQRAGERLRKALAAVEKIEARLEARHWTEADARRFALQDHEVAAYAELVVADRVFELALAHEVAASREAARVRLTREDLVGARLIRTAYGWHEIVRVNAKTVTVETHKPWNDHIRHGDVLEVRK